MNLLELVGEKVVPVLAIGLVAAIALVNLYLSVRKRFPARVNCWFCNSDTSVPYDNANSWHCPSCTQYNGFTEDGDYNREIPEQFQAARNVGRSNATDDDKITRAHNGLCFGCNRNQELKIHQLASFVPEVEENYDAEVEEYQEQLEQAYKLCGRCERVVKRTLNDVKRNILGSKLAQIGNRGLKALDLHMKVSGRREEVRKRKLVGDVCLAGIVVLVGMRLGQRMVEVELSKERLEAVMGGMLASVALIVISWGVALKDTLVAQVAGVMEHPVVVDGLEQLEGLKKVVVGRLSAYRKAEVPDSLLEEVLEATASVEELIDGQRNALFDLALISLAGMLWAVRSRVPKVKLAVVICCGALEMVLRTEAGGALLLAKGTTMAGVEMWLSSIALLTALSCLGQTSPRIDPTDSVNSSFHKIYSQQEDSIAQSDSEEPLLEASRCSHSIRSMDTTKSISPSCLTASTMRPFLECDSFATSPRSIYGGSMASVVPTPAPSAKSYASRQTAFGCLLKAPSFSVDNFTTAIPGTTSSRLTGFSMNAINQSTQFLLQEDDREADLDRLSISGRMSTRNTVVNNPFSTHHVDALNDSFSTASSVIRPRTNVSPPQFTVAPAESWIAGGYWGASPQKEVVPPPVPTQHPTMFMSRTSSQSSGFESQPQTRRPTPEEPTTTAAAAAAHHEFPDLDLDRVSLFSEPVGMFPSNASSVSVRLNQTLQPTSVTALPSPRRNLFGERGLFSGDSSVASCFERTSSFFPVNGNRSAVAHPKFGANHGWQNLGSATAMPSQHGGHRRSLLNLSKLGEVSLSQK